MSVKIWTMEEIEELKSGAAARPARPSVVESMGPLGDFVGQSGHVSAHLFLAPPDSAPYGLLRAPRASGADLEAEVFGVDASAAESAFYEQYEADWDAVVAWAHREGFTLGNDGEPLERSEAGAEHPDAVWILIPEAE